MKMKEIEFNLLDEPWIRVLLPDYQVKEVSLTEALLKAHTYVDLAGELPTQDVAVLRLLLAVLLTIFLREDEKGRARQGNGSMGSALGSGRISRGTHSELSGDMA